MECDGSGRNVFTGHGSHVLELLSRRSPAPHNFIVVVVAEVVVVDVCDVVLTEVEVMVVVVAVIVVVRSAASNISLRGATSSSAAQERLVIETERNLDVDRKKRAHSPPKGQASKPAVMCNPMRTHRL